MNIQFKGLKIGKLIITTEKVINKGIKVTLEPEEVWKIFKRAIEEKKIILPKEE